MAAGLPVLVSNRCGCAADLVVHGVNGFVFDPYDVDELAGVMTEISCGSCDRKAMGRASREIVAHWSPEHFAEGLGRAAEAAVSAPPPRPSLLDWLVLKILDRR